MQGLSKRVPMILSEQERLLLAKAFPSFLEAIERQGADFAEVQALLSILQKRPAAKGDEAGAVLEALQARITGLLDSVAPDPLTLEEASDLYKVNAATLRRACWAGKLPATMRGKSWFVRQADLERYLATSQKRRTRRSL
jgi:excisionase family DNA binding protein